MSKEYVMKERQLPLVRLYKQQPETAMVVDHARTEYHGSDPLHTWCAIGPEETVRTRGAVHGGVGGDHDGPVPGDVLCAALATCLDSTMRVVADRLGVEITNLEVTVRGHVDLRGTLMVDPNVPVGFQRFEVDVKLELAEGTKARQAAMLAGLAEHCCVVMHSLREATPVDVTLRAERLGQTGKEQIDVAI